MPNQSNRIIYSHETLEFVTVAAQYCAFLEQSADKSCEEFVDTLRKLLPLLYLKISLLPRFESNGDFLPADAVTEDDYNYIRSIAYSILSDKDAYLDIISDAERHTDDTQWKSISEGLADIYQALRNFVAVYQNEIEDCMEDALWAVEDNFELYWGQTLLDTLRQLHNIAFNMNENADEDYPE